MQRGYGPDLDVRPSAILKGRARAAHRCARIWQHMEWSQHACAQYRQWHDERTSETAQQAARPAAPAAAQPSSDMVRMDETVDVTKAREIPMIDAAIMNKGLLSCKRFVMREPFPEERRSLAQLTALLEILRCGGCYVDFALWGNYHIRTAKTFGCRRLVVGPGNVLIEQELKGPPDFEHWNLCWDVYQCGMIVGDACISPHLIAYCLLNKKFKAKYRSKCWPLLY